MGRSVMTLADSVQAFQSFEPSHYCDECEDYDYNCEHEIGCSYDCDHSEEFQDMLDDVRRVMHEMFPSMTDADSWIDRELHVVSSNTHSLVTVSEYCGLVSVCLGANYDRGDYWRDPEASRAALGAHWRSQVSERFLEAFSEYRKLGTFSNGESVYEKV